MFLYDLLFPKHCLGCGNESQYICPSCIKNLPKIRPICSECERASIDGLTHFKCKKTLGLDGLVCLWPYDGVVRKAILALKYKYAKEVATELSSYIQTKLVNNNVILPRSSVLIPIPLYFIKKNLRGFNQAEVIAKTISEKLGWDFNSKTLIRKKLRQPQTELKADVRRKNIKGVFSLSPNISISSYPNIIIFDDVYTTGSTLKEASKVLKRKGAKIVWGLTIAR